MSRESKLAEDLARLEKATQQTINTRGYSKDAKNLKILEEIIKEQLIHANTRTTTRTIR